MERFHVHLRSQSLHALALAKQPKRWQRFPHFNLLHLLLMFVASSQPLAGTSQVGTHGVAGGSAHVLLQKHGDAAGMPWGVWDLAVPLQGWGRDRSGSFPVGKAAGCPCPCRSSCHGDIARWRHAGHRRPLWAGWPCPLQARAAGWQVRAKEAAQ